MIKATGVSDCGHPLLILGLSGENVARLAADEPIVFDLAEVGMAPCSVVIMYGRTEDVLTAKLKAGGRIR